MRVGLTYICDKCISKFEPFRHKMSITNNDLKKRIDLCPKCYNSFVDWWARKERKYEDN